MTKSDHGKPDKRVLAALEDARAREIRAVQLYTLLAEMQTDPHRRDLFLRLADAERHHAERFAERIQALGGTPKPEPRLRPLDRLLTRLLGTETMLRRMEADEDRNIESFSKAARGIAADPETRRAFEEVEAEEEAHAHLLQNLGGSASPASRLEAILRGEKWHVNTGSWIGDAIYGVNDGLGAVFGIVSGMAGYTGAGAQVVFAGLLGTLASALSMGSSAFLAARAEREVHEAEIGREKREIEETPEHEREELALIYQLKGLSEEDASRMADAIASQPELFLKTMAQEELGLSESRMPNPWVSLVSATLSTAVGGIIPVLPFVFSRGTQALILAAIVSTLAHFAVGAAKSLVTARHWFISGLEMTVVGVVMGVVTYVLGVVFHIG